MPDTEDLRLAPTPLRRMGSPRELLHELLRYVDDMDALVVGVHWKTGTVSWGQTNMKSGPLAYLVMYLFYNISDWIFGPGREGEEEEDGTP